MAAKKVIRRPNQAVQRPSNDSPDDADEEDLTTPDEGTDEIEPDDDSSEGNDDAAEGDTDDQQSEEPAPRMMGRPRDGRTFRTGEKIVFKGMKSGGLITSQENIYRGVQTPGSMRWRYHLILARGSQVSESRTKKISESEYETTID